MVEHARLQLFAGMDDRIGVPGGEPSGWRDQCPRLSGSNIGADARFQVVINVDDKRRRQSGASQGWHALRRMIQLCFGADDVVGQQYHLMIESARFADAQGYDVWTTEQAFHGLADPTRNVGHSAAVAALTRNIEIRGQCVLRCTIPLASKKNGTSSPYQQWQRCPGDCAGGTEDSCCPENAPTHNKNAIPRHRGRRSSARREGASRGPAVR